MASVLGLSATAAFLYPLFRFLFPVESQAKIGAITVARREVPLGGAKDLIFGALPLIIINTREKGYLAFSRVCPHLGCLVKFDEKKRLFICPCHAGIFDLEGNVVSGPPPKPLTQFSVKITGDNLVIREGLA